MVSIYIATSVPVTETSISVACNGLTALAGLYAKIEFICNNGDRIRVEKLGDNGGTVNNYRSHIATFTGLNPGTAYSFRVECMRFSTSDPYGEMDGPINQSTLVPSITVGAVTGLYAYNVLAEAFSITWNAASGAFGYQIYRRIQGQTNWNISYTGDTAWRFTGLAPETYYEIKVRGYTGDVYGPDSQSLLVRTQSNAPSDLAWPNFLAGSDSRLLTAKNWNDFTSKINAWRVFRGMSSLSFPVAYTGNYVTASIFNQATSALVTLNPPSTPPQQVASGDIFSAAKINALGSSVDSLN